MYIDIRDLTSVTGKDGKITDTQGKDFWSLVCADNPLLRGYL